MKWHIPLDRLSNPPLRQLLVNFDLPKHGTSTGTDSTRNACRTFSKRFRRWRCSWWNSVDVLGRLELDERLFVHEKFTPHFLAACTADGSHTDVALSPLTSSRKKRIDEGKQQKHKAAISGP